MNRRGLLEPHHTGSGGIEARSAWNERYFPFFAGLNVTDRNAAKLIPHIFSEKQRN